MLLGSRNVVLEDVNMNAALRHDRQTVHDAIQLPAADDEEQKDEEQKEVVASHGDPYVRSGRA